MGRKAAVKAPRVLMWPWPRTLHTSPRRSHGTHVVAVLWEQKKGPSFALQLTCKKEGCFDNVISFDRKSWEA